jgi:hypothetical protein
MSFPPTAGKGYMSGVGSAGKTGDSKFHPRFLSVPIMFFMVPVCIRALIGAVFSLEIVNWWFLYGFRPFTVTSRDALMACRLPIAFVVAANLRARRNKERIKNKKPTCLSCRLMGKVTCLHRFLFLLFHLFSAFCW